MRTPGALFPAGLLLAAMVTVPAAFADTSPHPMVPGVVNYVEGQAAINDQPLNATSMGAAQLEPGESLTTTKGRAEVLLTPGVFLRLDDHGAAEMVSAGLTRTEVGLDQGEALVEVDEIHAENDLRVSMGDVATRLVKNGLYDFEADRGRVRVIEGKAIVEAGDHSVSLTSGWQLDLNERGSLVPVRFDQKAFRATDLYRWSSLRSKYLAEASVEAARRYYVGGWYSPYGPGWYAPGWYGAGWYWDPWLSTYTFVPAEGVLYGAFGWSYYSPRYAHRVTRDIRPAVRDLTVRHEPQAYWPGRDRDHDGGRGARRDGGGRRR